MNATVKRIVLMSLTVVLTSLICITMYIKDNKYNENGLSAQEGVLVVEEGDLEDYPVSHLVTGWIFYPDVLLTPKDVTDGSPKQAGFYMSIGDITRFDVTGNPNEPHGSGSYFLRLSLPKETATYALEVPEIYSAYNLYVGDRLVLQMGNPNPDSYRPLTQNRMITFEASGDTSLLFAVTDESHFYSGMVYPPAFGTMLGVDSTKSLRMGIALFVNTIALLGALLSLYFGLRMKHNNALLFSLLCVVLSVFTSYSLFHSMLALPIFPWYALEMSSGYLLSLLLIILYNRISDADLYAKWISQTVAAIVFVTALCYGLLSAYLTVNMMRIFSTIVFFFKLALPAYLLITAALSLRKTDNSHMAPLFYASITYATTFIWDRIFPAYEPIRSGWFIEWGSLALLGAIGYTLWRDITTTYEKGIVFAQEHRMMTRQLAMQTEYARQLQTSNDENRRLTHDFRHHLHTIGGIAAQLGENNEVLRYLEEHGKLVASSSAKNQHFCDDVAINALLQYYTAITTEHQIQTDFQIQIPDNLDISKVELCTVLGNLLENAVDACLRQQQDKRNIKISSNLVGKTLFLVVENDFDGNYQMEKGRFLSRKSAQPRYGVGLESAKHTIEQHGGSLDVFLEPTVFRVGITLKVR